MSDHEPDHPILLDVSPRYADLGPDGLVSTFALVRWFEDVRVGLALPRFARMVADGDHGPYRWLLASMDVERRAPIPWTGKLRVGAGIRRIGRSSFTHGYEVLGDDGRVAVGETVQVLADDAGPTELPDAMRADLQDLALDDPARPGPARPAAARHERAYYPYAHRVRARIGDIDTNRHGNNVALVSWYADAVAALATEATAAGWGGPAPEILPSRYAVQYVAEVGYPGDYEVALAVTAHDEQVVHYELGLFAGPRCVGLADATGGRSALPAATLDALRPTGPCRA